MTPNVRLRNLPSPAEYLQGSLHSDLGIVLMYNSRPIDNVRQAYTDPANSVQAYVVFTLPCQAGTLFLSLLYRCLPRSHAFRD
ncbi:unnamed protein product [Alternaria burnsii]|nr:unnamed protein product [Alternaria burnsii]